MAHRVNSELCLEWSLLDNSGQIWILARDGLSAFDPSRASASISCCSSEAAFDPFRDAQLSRYDATS
jgi:hypothetical protein